MFKKLFLILFFINLVFSQSFTWLGSLETPYAEAHGVSDDGRVVAGWAGVYSPHYAWRWTPETGMVIINPLSPGRSAEAWGLSANGAVVVGYGFIGTSNIYRGFRWHNDTMYQFGTLGGSVSWAYDASYDGLVVVGSAEHSSGYNHAFRWKPDSGMQDLGTLPGALRSVATGVSLDGRVVVGWSGFPGQIHHAFRWENGVMEDIHNPAFGFSEALDVSGNGEVVVGVLGPTSSTPLKAFRWTRTTGMYDLGTLGGEWSEAWAANYDGSIVVGWAEVSQGDWHAFRWTENNGMEDLNVTYANIIPPGCVLRDAMAISSNGRFIVGRGYNAQTGRDEAYLLDTQGTGLTEDKFSETNLKTLLVKRNFLINYEIPKKTDVKLIIYDKLGKEIKTLINKIQEPGKYSLKFNINDLPNNVYFYKLKIGKSFKIGKIINCF
ncbi:MAG: HAF repeat-containing protein [candidate division WOR-3 bacterium]|nr:HAF repeat-containing protein [candidate division WOR-3 bacterium]MCX7837745.1 HAF repeat-containing protein [candidate division WOR-3 bacterium]MDW8113851.1 HAF repeat-containing protein [candidate division WOR-3 bacterium]